MRPGVLDVEIQFVKNAFPRSPSGFQQDMRSRALHAKKLRCALLSTDIL